MNQLMVLSIYNYCFALADEPREQKVVSTTNPEPIDCGVKKYFKLMSMSFGELEGGKDFCVKSDCKSLNVKHDT